MLALRYSEVDITIIEGARTEARQKKLVGRGSSWTLKSKHLVQPDGFAFAVDLAPWIDGDIPWENKEAFGQINKAVRKAAKILDVDVRWGGNFRTTYDGPHFELTDDH